MRRWIGERLSWGRVTTAWIVAFSHSFVAITTLLQSVILARLLPLHEFGLLATALAVAAIAEASINARGSETSLAVFSTSRARTSEDRATLVRKLFLIDLAWSGCAYALLLAGTLIYDWITGGSSKLLYGLFLSGFLSFPWGTAKGYITVYLSARKFAPVELSYATVAFVVGPMLAYFMGAWGVVLSMIGASLVRTIVSLWVVGFRSLNSILGPFRSNEFDRKVIWWFGSTGTVRSALINGLQQVDLLLMAALSSPSGVGLYRAAKTVTGIPQRLGQPVWVLLKRQIISRASAKDDIGRNDAIILTSALLFLLGTLVTPILILHADDGMALVFGTEFAPAGKLLWYLLPAAWLMYGVTGWSATYGSISKRRVFVIGIYLTQLLVVVATAWLTGGSMQGIALGVALSQVAAAAAFWMLYLGNRAARGAT